MKKHFKNTLITVISLLTAAMLCCTAVFAAEAETEATVYETAAEEVIEEELTEEKITEEEPAEEETTVDFSEMTEQEASAESEEMSAGEENADDEAVTSEAADEAEESDAEITEGSESEETMSSDLPNDTAAEETAASEDMTAEAASSEEVSETEETASQDSVESEEPSAEENTLADNAADNAIEEKTEPQSTEDISEQSEDHSDESASEVSVQEVQEEDDNTAEEQEITDLIEEYEEAYADLTLDSDELLSNYMGIGNDGVYTFQSLYSNYNGNKLTDLTAVVYGYLKDMVIQVAAGTISNTELTVKLDADDLSSYRWTAEDLGVESLFADEEQTSLNRSVAKIAMAEIYNSGLAVKSVVRDCPYELFWFSNKYSLHSTYTPFIGKNTETGEYVLGFKSAVLQIGMGVSADYIAADDGETDNTYTTDVSKIQSIQTAINTANSIVAEAAELGDEEKLDYYRSSICDLTAYNYGAGDGTAYGNPWQIIYVFDGDPATKVVCEGYAKSFQYLCDQSTFNSSDLYVYSVSGTFDYGSGTQGHLWNIIHKDGKNYMADITNCDGSTPHTKLFLANPISGSVDSSYTFAVNGAKYTYTYYSDTRLLYADDELEMDIVHEWDEGVVSREATCSEYGILTYTCALCGETKEEEFGPLAEHTVVTDQAVEPTCTEEGKTEGSHCSVCGTVFQEQETVPATGHDWGEGTVVKAATCTQKGQLRYTCSVCGDEKTEDIEKTAHVKVTDKGYSATYFSTGLSNGTHCSVCGTILTKQTEIPMKELTRVLSLWTYGQDVLEVQQQLKKLGYLTVEPDGVYGYYSQTAVSEFQQANGFSNPDGEVGSFTMEKLRSKDAVSKQDAAASDVITISHTLTLGSTGDEVLAVQKRLKELGYLTVEPDGVYGAYTQAAVTEFQLANGLSTPDGMVGNWTVAKLNSNPVAKSQTSGSTDGKITISHTLSVGSTGSEVLAVQKRLKELGYLSVEPDGVYGAYTKAAVTEFQLANGLSTPDGMVGNWTITKLNGNPVAKSDASGSTAAYSGPLSKGSTGTAVLAVQQKLAAAGYLTAVPDGIFGGKTQDAVIRFQQDHGINADGIVGEITWGLLF